MSEATRSDSASMIQLFINATQEYCNNRTLVLNGVPVKNTVLVQRLQGQLTAAQLVASTHAAWQRAVAAWRSQFAPDVKTLAAELRTYVTSAFGLGSEAYQAFGFKAPRKATKPVEVKAQAVQQMRATRAARHTMGSKQKLAIHGVVESAPASSSATSTAPAASANGTAASTNGTAATGATANPSSPGGNGTPSH
jgi:hypothetical protein